MLHFTAPFLACLLIRQGLTTKYKDTSDKKDALFTFKGKMKRTNTVDLTSFKSEYLLMFYQHYVMYEISERSLPYRNGEPEQFEECRTRWHPENRKKYKSR